MEEEERFSFKSGVQFLLVVAVGLRLDGVGVGLSSSSWRLGLDSNFSSAS